MAMDPIGTPRRSTSLATSAASANGAAVSSIWSEPAGTNGAGGGNSPAEGGIVQSEHVQALWERFNFLKNTDNIKNNLLEEVLTRYSHLTKVFDEYKRETERTLSADYSDSKSDDVEIEIEAYKEHCNKLFSLLTRDAFAMILIDGDSMIFDKDLLRLGEEGGKKAASHLKTVATQYIAGLGNMPDQIRIATRIYANVSGLAQTLVRAGTVSSVTLVEDFIRGFMHGDQLFDFIDVGYGKDHAEGKVTANLMHEIYNYQCRHILLGCSHNKDFAQQLGKLVNDQSTLEKVTLLEGAPYGKELADLPFQKTTFDGLFRKDKIIVNQQNPLDLVTDFSRLRHDSKNNVFNPNSAVFTPPSQTPAPATPLFSPKSGGDALISLRNDLTRTNSMSSVALSEAPATGGATPNGGGWANIAKASATLPYKDLTKKVAEPQVTGPVVMLNKDGHRIDKEMDYDHDKVYKLKQIKLCNQHYIGRGCCHYQAGNRNCPHRHDLALTAEDKKWLRVVARETVCKKGTTCLEVDCIYGHHCPYPKQTEGPQRGKACINGHLCRFHKDMHDMDYKVVKTLRAEDLDLFDDEVL